MPSRNAAPSSAPIANETSIGTQDARSNSANAAAPTDSAPPARLAATIQPRVIGSLYADESLEPRERSHALARSIAAERKELLTITVGALRPAEDPRNSGAREALSRNRVQVEQPMMRPHCDECSGGCCVAREERIAYLVADFIHARSDRRTEPCEHALRSHGHRLERRFDHARRQAAPAGVGKSDRLAGFTGEQHRHAVRGLDRAHGTRAAQDERVAFERRAASLRKARVVHPDSVHLVQPQRLGGKQGTQSLAPGCAFAHVAERARRDERTHA